MYKVVFVGLEATVRLDTSLEPKWIQINTLGSVIKDKRLGAKKVYILMSL